MAAAQKPLELILARNLLTSVTTPGFLVSRDGSLLFYNEAAGAALGRPFEDVGQLTAAEWAARFGPLDDDGEPIPLEDLPLTRALRAGRPAHAEFSIRPGDGHPLRVAASAMPIVGTVAGGSGAMVIFWPLDDEHSSAISSPDEEAATS